MRPFFHFRYKRIESCTCTLPSSSSSLLPPNVSLLSPRSSSDPQRALNLSSLLPNLPDGHAPEADYEAGGDDGRHERRDSSSSAYSADVSDDCSSDNSSGNYTSEDLRDDPLRLLTPRDPRSKRRGGRSRHHRKEKKNNGGGGEMERARNSK